MIGFIHFHFKQKAYLLIDALLALSVCILLMPHLYQIHHLFIQKIHHIHNSIQLSYEWYFTYDLIKSDIDHAYQVIHTETSFTITRHNETITYKNKNDRLYRYCTEPKSQFCVSSKLKNPSITMQNNSLMIRFDNFSSPIILLVNN